MPTPRQYKAGSVIYFDGDPNSNSVFLLKSGMLQKTYISIESNREEKSKVIVGEFFGVKSALGKYKREETIQVLSDSMVLIFTPEEFEAIIANNVNIILKILRVFSTELRKIGKQIASILESDDGGMSTTEKLIDIGEYYLKQKKYSQAIYAFEKYMQYNPYGEHLSLVKDRMKHARELIEMGNRTDMNEDPESPTRGKQGELDDFSNINLDFPNAPQISEQMETARDKYNDGDFDHAINDLNEVIAVAEKNNLESQISESAYFMRNSIYLMIKEHEECINQGKEFLKAFPQSEFKNRILLNIGVSYAGKGSLENAQAIFSKIKQTAPDSQEAFKADKFLAEYKKP